MCRVVRGVGAAGGRGSSDACTADSRECWCSRWGGEKIVEMGRCGDGQFV